MQMNINLFKLKLGCYYSDEVLDRDRDV